MTRTKYLDDLIVAQDVCGANELLRTFIELPDGTRVAEVFENCQFDSDDCARNANLFTAAPNAMEVLQEVVSLCESGLISNTHGGRDFDYVRNIGLRAKAVIQMAGGEK